MAQENKKVDVVTVGAGLVAGIVAYELTKPGSKSSRWSRARG